MSRPTLVSGAVLAPPGASGRARPLVIADGTLEALKWLALILMTLDHVNKYMLKQSMPLLFTVGRIAMPLFVFVLAYNLARPEALASGAIWRTARRLALWGALACVPFIALGYVSGGWWPLNMLVTLLVTTVVIGLLQQPGRWSGSLAVVVFLGGGALVEYWWFAVALGLSCWHYCRRPDKVRLFWLVVFLTALWAVNQVPWALAALPLMLAAPYVHLSVPRYGRLFYFYYPAHLAAIWVLNRALA